MSVIVVGSNTFVNCTTPLAIDDTPAVEIGADDRGGLALSIAIKAPPAQVPVLVDRNRAMTDGVRVTTDPDVVRVHWREHRIASVQRAGAAISLEFDFRPLGLQVYADTAALHVGSGRFSGTTINASRVGIQLATGGQASEAARSR